MSKFYSAYERTLVLLKPDAVQRGLMGEIISRFERKGLKITAMRMVWPTTEMSRAHYDWPEAARLALGERTLAGYKEKGIENNATPLEIAERVQNQLVNYLTTGPILAMVIEGAHAITFVRKIRGGVNPLSADIGSITADYSIDSYFLADEGQRAIRSLVHASGSVEEAEVEIKIWFKEEDIFDYQTAIDKVLYSRTWEEDNQETLRDRKID